MNQLLHLDESWDAVSAIPEASATYHQAEYLCDGKIVTDLAD
jgi:hypothetical protein